MSEVKFQACQTVSIYYGCPSGSFAALVGEDCGFADAEHCEEGDTSACNGRVKAWNHGAGLNPPPPRVTMLFLADTSVKRVSGESWGHRRLAGGRA